MRSKLLTTFAGLLFFSIQMYGQENMTYSKELFIKGSDTLRYRMLIPKDFSEEREYPLILFLHGAGERGNDNEKQLTHGSKLFTNDTIRTNYPAIVIFPQCAGDDYWAQVAVDRSHYPIGLDFNYEKGPTAHMGMVMDLLDKTLQQSYIKKDQVYLMGLSMGGMGTFELLYRKPDVFAAAVPICGAGVPKTVSAYAKNVPLWVFHGAQDNVVAPVQSVSMINALLEEGAYPKFTLYDFANHNSWDPAFSEPDLLPWLFSKIKSVQ